MPSNTEYRVVADKIVSPDSDVVLEITGNLYKGSVAENNRYATIADVGDGGGSSADIADFVFETVEEPDYESSMTVTNNSMVIKTIVDTEASGEIRVESAQGLILHAHGDTLIQSANGSDVVKARITLDQSNEQVLLEAINPNSQYFPNNQWTTATWSGYYIEIIEPSSDLINYLSTSPYNVNGVSINEDATLLSYYGATFGEGIVTLNVSGEPAEDLTTITSIEFFYNVVSKIDIDHDSGYFDIEARGMSMNISSDNDVTVHASGDDLRLRAFDDILFTAGADSGTQYGWRMDNTGRFELPANGYIENPDGASSDNNGNDTLHLVPDGVLVEDTGSHQYIIIEPTEPNHIHIRAGGTIDDSNSELILGGEDTNVTVSDTNSAVDINSAGNVYVNAPLQLNNYLILTSAAPETSAGQAGDRQGSVIFSSTHIYYCVSDYVDGLTNIWKRVALSDDTWPGV